MQKVTIYTDGGCRGNPGPGGWGAVLQYQGEQGLVEKELKGNQLETTNNQMELMAAIEAFKILKRPCAIKLYTDSVYVRDGITEWIQNWRARGWKTANKKPVKNMALWQQLDALNQTHSVDWKWVKGHAGNPGNERADALANAAMDELMAGSVTESVAQAEQKEA